MQRFVGCFVLALVGGLALAPPPAQGHPPAVLAPNERIRLVVSQPTRHRIVARIVSTSDSTMTIYSRALVPRQQSVRLDAIDALEVPDGQRTKVARNAGVGLAAGMGLGVMVGLASGDDPPDWVSFTAGQKAMIGAIFFGLIGLTVGAITGLTSYEEAWRPVDVDHLQLRASPDGQPSVAFAVGF